MFMADTASPRQSGKALGATRFAAGCGAAFAVLLLVGFALQDTGASSPSVSTAEVVSSYSDAGTELRKELGATVVGFAVFFLLVFLGSLRSTLRRAEGVDHHLSSAAFAGGIVMVVFLGASAALETAVASADGFYDSYEVDASTVLAFSTLALWALGFAMVGAAVLVGSASLLAWKVGLLPKWLAIAGLVVAALGFFGESTAALVVPLILAAAWLLVVSVILVRRVSSSED
jgi:hypothetical protein